MADNLESYFRKKLSEDAPGDGNWNVPSDKVWENVLPKIQKKRGLFIPWRYIYLFGILLVASLISVVWYINTPLTNENESITIVETEKSNKDPIVDETVNSDESPGQEKAVETNTTESSNSNADLASTKNDSDITSAEKASANAEINTSHKQITAFYSETQNTYSANNVSLNMNREKEQLNRLNKKSIKEISSPLALTIEEHRVLETPPVNESQSNIKEPLNNKGRIGIGAFFTPTFNSTSVQGEPLQGAIETSNMLMYSSNWGFEFRYFLSNRFTLVTGIGKSEIRSWSKSLIDFGYDSSTEHTMPSGEKENTSAVPMPTPFGEIDTEITYRFSGDDEIPDGEPMYSAMETHQDIRYLSIPLGVEFNIIRFSRFNWFVEGGIRYNRALKDATQFTSRILHDGNDMDVVNEEMTSHPSYTENYLNFYIGTGVNYQFSKSFQISGSVRYFGNITNVNIQNNMSTYVHGFDLKIGIVYIF